MYGKKSLSFSTAIFLCRLIYALDSVLASYKAMTIANAETDKFEVNDGKFIKQSF